MKEKYELDTGDKIEFTPEEELERAEWELNIAQTAYFKALRRVAFKYSVKEAMTRYAGTLKALADYDKGLREVDTSPGSELAEYSKKHG